MKAMLEGKTALKRMRRGARHSALMMLQVFLVFGIDDVCSRILWDNLRTRCHIVNLYPLEQSPRQGDQAGGARGGGLELRSRRAGDPDPPFDKGIIKA